MSNAALNDALKGEPPPEWTRRPNVKDELRASARELRGQGLDYEEIAVALGVAKSSVSLWIRDLPTPARLSYAECRKTVRKNVGDDYRGCLRIDVCRSADLYRKIEGWAAAIMGCN